MWFAPTPRVPLTDPELTRTVLSNKFEHFQKQKAGPLGRLLATGLANYEGEKGGMHRRIINPSFHVEKLKVIRGHQLSAQNHAILREV